jgi:hypothetical protein
VSALARAELSRRGLIRSAALAGGGLLIPGCATTSSLAGSARTGCLAPVRASEDRVIRSVVGLRPFRRSGFVVRAEALGEKRLVHNYGHGGAGVTLSWGTSKLATQLGLQGHQRAVAVIGAGVVGLSTARLVQEAGFPVTLYAAALPPDTTSNIAGGQWHPFGLFREDAVTPQWREQFKAAADYSWRRFQIMAGDEYGIRWLPTYSEGDPEAPLLPTFPPAMRALQASEHPFPVERVYRYQTMYVEMGRYLRQMTRDVMVAGGRIVVRSFASPAEIAALPEGVVFNCTGLGARGLFGDTELRPVRGQLAILLPQPELAYAYTFEAGYMFPRPDGVVLGGTFETGNWSLDSDPATTTRIVKAHQALFAGGRCSAA